MKFKIDENLPLESAEILRDAGYDVKTVRDEGLEGEPNFRIYSVCCLEERRILITLDVGFSNILTYPPSKHVGVIVLRLSNQSKQSVLEIIKQLLLAFKQANPKESTWIVDDNKLRIRRHSS